MPVFISTATKNKTYSKIKKKNHLSCYKHISLLYLYSQTPWKHYLYSYPLLLSSSFLFTHSYQDFTPTPLSKSALLKVTNDLYTVPPSDQFSRVILLSPSLWESQFLGRLIRTPPGAPEEEKGVWSSRTGDRGLEFSRRRKDKHLFFFSTFLSLSDINGFFL